MHEGKKEDIQALIRNGTISAGAVVWTHGLMDWEAVGVHFSLAIPNCESITTEYSETFPAEPQTARKAKSFSLLLFLFFLSVSAGLNGHLFPNIFTGILPTGTLPAVVDVAAALVCLLASASVLHLLWVHPFQRSFPTFSGSVLAVSVLAITIQTILAISLVYHLPVMIRVEKAIQPFRDYNVHFSAEDRTVRVDGLIGPGLVSRIRDIERLIGSIDVLEIDSPGGLVDEAMEFVGYLDSREQTYVIARNNCASACVLVLVSTSKSYADSTMEFGFHGVSSVVEVEDEVLEYATRTSGDENAQFLLANGVPAQVVNASRELQGEDLLLVPARRLVEAGAIRGLVNGNTIVFEGPKS